jgi:hypothetical protein
MERLMWTDQRLDDLAQKVDAGFERVDRDIRELRSLVWRLWAMNIVATVAALIAATRL